MSATATHATVQRSTRRTGLDPRALWEDAKLGFAHMFDWDRFAVVTDLEWIGLESELSFVSEYRVDDDQVGRRSATST